MSHLVDLGQLSTDGGSTVFQPFSVLKNGSMAQTHDLVVATQSIFQLCRRLLLQLVFDMLPLRQRESLSMTQIPLPIMIRGYVLPLSQALEEQHYLTWTCSRPNHTYDAHPWVKGNISYNNSYLKKKKKQYCHHFSTVKTIKFWNLPIFSVGVFFL